VISAEYSVIDENDIIFVLCLAFSTKFNVVLTFAPSITVKTD